ncbi:MAG: ABC transporter substrate-binding protein [Alphaproteobacteria bacterium]|nr:ABC transporter substrate-binding protein [Alphaproteobacteria bacterium]
MAFALNRRQVMRLAAAEMALCGLGLPAWAQASDAISIAFPIDVPTWDPNARVLVGVQSLYKCVFDSPLTQAADLSVQPAIVKSWRWLDQQARELELELRDDVVFHNGHTLTAEDIRYTFLERPRAPVPEGQRKLDTSFIWRKLSDVEIAAPTHTIMHFSEPMPTAVTWLYFLASFVVPKKHLETAGLQEFSDHPVGSGPYRLVEYQQGARAVLEAFDKYWGGAPKIKRVTVEFVRDASARVAAIEAKQVALSVDLPIREITRLGQAPGLVGRVDPIADILLLQITKSGGFAKDEVRLAAHHAINKEAISKALYAGNAKPISVPAAWNTPGYPADFSFPFSEAKALELLKQAGYGPSNPVKIKFFSSNGNFPNDFEMARAIVAMWKKVGIDADLEVIEVAKYQELLRANQLPEASLYQWGNATGDPEMYGGYLLDPKSIFSAFKADDLGERIAKLLVEPDQEKRYAGWREVHAYAVEKGYSIPLLQGVKTVAYQQTLEWTKYDNGWILPQSYALKA